MPALTAIRQRTFAGDTSATVAALLDYHWIRLDVTTVAGHNPAAGDTPLVRVGTMLRGDDVEPPIMLPLARLGELPARWVYIIDPHADTLTVLSTNDPTTPIATHTLRRMMADPATTGQPSPDPANTTASSAASPRRVTYHGVRRHTVVCLSAAGRARGGAPRGL